MANETVVRYNDITLNDVQTVAWDETAVYDESGTDIIYTEYTATFAGIVTDGAINLASPYTDDGNSATMIGRLDSIRKYMLEPRGRLLVTCNSVTILDVPAAPSNGLGVANNTSYDVQNGPKPIDFQVVNVWGGKVLRVLWSVKTCLHKWCSPRQRQEVLNNRWEVSETVDNLKYVTRTINGEMKLASYASVPAMGYKTLVVPPLETGFRRESIDYDVSADGLTCRYSIVDKQVEVAAPWPAASIELTHTESTNNGITIFSAARCSLVGQPNATPAHLIQRAVSLIEKRLRIAGKPRTYLIQNSSITVIFSVNLTVQVELSIQRTPGESKSSTAINTGIAAGVALRSSLGKEHLSLPSIPGGGPGGPYVVEQSLPPAIWGYDVRADALSSAGRERLRSPALAAALRVYLQEPCGNHGIADHKGNTTSAARAAPTQPAATGGAAGFAPENLGGVNVNFNNNLPSVGDPAVYSKEAFQDIYLDVRVHDEWLDDDMRVALPVADTESADGTAFARLAKRQTVRRVSYAATRVDSPPQVPDLPESYTDGEGRDKATGYRMSFRRKLQDAKPSPSGEKLIYKLTQSAEYRFTKPLSDDTKRAIMKMPIMASNPKIPDGIVMQELVNKNIGVARISQSTSVQGQT